MASACSGPLAWVHAMIEGTYESSAVRRQRPPCRLPGESGVHHEPPSASARLAASRRGRGRKTTDIEWALRELRTQSVTVIWVPGNHEPWTLSTDPIQLRQLRGEARYRYLVAMCRRSGVITPEDPYMVWRGADGPLVVVPLFLLYDYSFRPDGTATKDEALSLAYESIRPWEPGVGNDFTERPRTRSVAGE
jgi:hypothetical protein